MMLRCAYAASPESIEKLWALTGMEPQLAHIPSAVVQGFDSGSFADLLGQVETEALALQIRSALSSSFSPEQLSRVIRSTLSDTLSEQQITHALAWHESPLGQKVVALELQRSALVVPDRRKAFLQNLNKNALTGKRAQLFAELDDALKMTESSVALMLDMQVAMSVNVMNSLLGSRRLTPSELIELYEPQRDELTRHYARESLLSMLFTYADLSTADIIQYTQFALSPSGQGYVDAMNLGLHKAMLEASYHMGKALDGLIRQSAHDRVL